MKYERITETFSDIVTEKFNVNSDFETAWEYSQNTALSDSHVTSLQRRPSKATSRELGNAPKPLALDTKPTIWGEEHRVAFAKKHDEAFKSEALVNENELLMRGATNDTSDAAASDVDCEIETIIARRSPTPHAVLQ